MRDVIKRGFDILVCSVMLILLCPVLFFIGIWIKADSAGPIIFLQKRIGRGARVFYIYKFRTMIDRSADVIDQNAEQVVSEGGDPRITGAGRFLRAASLDELPQLFNILKGDMSLVGPRPIIPEQLEVVPAHYMNRFDVSPGLTGLAQVRGRRSLGWLEQLAADSEYVHKYRFRYDLWILLRTVVVVLKGSGVYGGEGENWRTYRDNLNKNSKRLKGNEKDVYLGRHKD